MVRYKERHRVKFPCGFEISQKREASSWLGDFQVGGGRGLTIAGCPLHGEECPPKTNGDEE